MAQVNEITIVTRATQQQAASSAYHLVRKTEMDAAISGVTTHAAVTVADTDTVTLTLVGQHLTADVDRKVAFTDTAQGALGADSGGLFMSLGSSAYQAAPGNHGHDVATAAVAGFLSTTHYSQLISMAWGATANSADSALLSRANHTGTQAAYTVYDFAGRVEELALLVDGSNSMTGMIQFTGTAHAGIRLINLSNSEVSALSPTGGELVFNTSYAAPYYYDGTEWAELSGSGTGAAAGDLFGVITSTGLETFATPYQMPLTAHTPSPSGRLVGRYSSGSGAWEFLAAADIRGMIDVELGATANSADSVLLARGNHTGTQTWDTISNFEEGVQAFSLTAGGGTLTGPINFSGDDNRGMTLSRLTTEERNTNITPVCGTAIFNLTTNTFQGYDGNWASFLTTSGTGFVERAGDVMSGILGWTGTDHLGIHLLNLTEGQRDAQLASPGYLHWNSSMAHANVYGETGWYSLAHLEGDTFTGPVAFNDTISLLPMSYDQVAAIVPQYGQVIFHGGYDAFYGYSYTGWGALGSGGVGGSGGTVQGLDAVLDIQATDEGTVAGNTRGESSIDLQTDRDLSSQVASGSWSVLVGGRSNQASKNYSAAVGGRLGKSLNTERFFAFAGISGVAGTAQGGETFLSLRSTGGLLAEELFIDGTGGSDRISIPVNYSMRYEISIVARNESGSSPKTDSWVADGTVVNNGGTSSLIEGTLTKKANESSSTTGFAIAVDDTSITLKFTDDGSVWNVGASVRLSYVFNDLITSSMPSSFLSSTPPSSAPPSSAPPSSAPPSSAPSSFFSSAPSSTP